MLSNAHKKYFYNSLTIYMYCKYKEYNYQSVTRSIRYRISKYKDKNHTLEYIINEVINIYTIRKKRKIIRSIIINNDYPINVNKICKELQIYRNSVYKVMKHHFTIRESIIIIYFLHDIEKQQISISEKNINKIIYELNNNCYTKELKNLFCYKYLGYDTKYDIYNELQKSFLKIAKRKTILYFQHADNSLMQDFTNEFYIFLCNLLEEVKIISSINYQLKWSTIKYAYRFMFDILKNEKRNQNMYHLEQEIKENYTLMDTVGSYDTYSL